MPTLPIVPSRFIVRIAIQIARKLIIKKFVPKADKGLVNPKVYPLKKYVYPSAYF